MHHKEINHHNDERTHNLHENSYHYEVPNRNHHRENEYTHTNHNLGNHETTHMNQSTTFVGEGQRVLVEKRTFSPEREPVIEKIPHQDWADYSRHQWDEQHHGSKQLKKNEYDPYNPYRN